MTRKSKRELARDVDELSPGAGDGDADLGRPLTAAEREALGEDADAWGETRPRRAVFRALSRAGREARNE